MQNTIDIYKKKNWYYKIDLRTIRLNAYRIGFVSMGACFFLFLQMFMVAFNNPGKNLLIGINWQGEALLELVLLLLAAPFVLYTIYDFRMVLRKIKSGEI